MSKVSLLLLILKTCLGSEKIQNPRERKRGKVERKREGD